ncbi:MAG: hypothetical protein Q8W46_10250 [Candidatus Palauibacterales bacterium]|jgi:hypothetical protein|nr:hypothetical protein [Candidatus Palauibacterales bacterium]
MMDDRNEGDRPEPVELTAAEREALDALPREREPGRLLEERTVRTLRDEGLLASGPGRRVESASDSGMSTRRPWWRSAAAIAAGIALFAGGLSVGQVLGARQTADALQTVFVGRDARLASEVQRTGSDYVAALAALSEVDFQQPADSGQALEVALTALWAAANEIVRLAPDDPLTARILQGFEARARESNDRGPGGQLLVEF